jgi:hypothetical protein
MRRIKKFESFTTKYRLPTKVSEDEWIKKFHMQSIDTYTKKELDIFEKLKEDNPSLIESCEPNGDETEVSITIFSIINDLIVIYITKLSDDWYLILEQCGHEYEEFYICDEWDEVLGYLSSKNLNLPI